MSTTKRTTKQRNTTNVRTRVKAMRHREGTAAAKAHKFVREHLSMATTDLAKQIQRRYKRTPNTARHWASTFKRTPLAQART